MKIAAAIISFFIMISGMAFADELTLSATETLQPTESSKIKDWEITKINATDQILIIKYRWADSNGDIIYLNSNTGGFNYFVCLNGDPADPTCFSDIFGFEMRTQDVGTKIGVGFRSLIVNKMKARGIIDSDNNVTFDTN